MKKSIKSAVLATGLAMFSMFFGAGNITFPLVLGQYAGDQNVYAILGLIITAILVPFTGLLAMVLFEGNYRSFFHRIGKVPGTLFIFLIMILIGPLAGIPRCITLSYSTSNFSGIEIPFWLFNFLACIVLYICACKRSRIVDLLGYALSPLLILFLCTIIVVGFINPPSAVHKEFGTMEIFVHGLKEGYNTLDLLAAFFFSTVVLYSLKKSVSSDLEESTKRKLLIKKMIQSTLIAASLLTFIYASMSFIASFYCQEIGCYSTDQLLAAISFLLLGDYAGVVASITVSLTCLTTAITLCAVFSTFFRNEVFQDKISYKISLLITIIVTFIIGFLGFRGIIAFVAPILFICYPTFICMTLFNLAHKLWGVRIIKIPVLLTFLISLTTYLVF
jgi:LIVCS family branched-chain amino acid:cation transporter